MSKPQVSKKKLEWSHGKFLRYTKLKLVGRNAHAIVALD